MISREDIEHLKELARVEFGKGDTEKLAHDLGAILDHIDSLKEADISNAPLLSHPTDLKNVFRDDSSENKRSEAKELLEEKAETARALIGAFPEKHEAGHGVYLKVKAIL